MAIRKHLSPKNMHFVIITKDAEAPGDLLLKAADSSIKNDAPKPSLAAEDKTIGNYKLNLKPGKHLDRERGRRGREATRAERRASP